MGCETPTATRFMDTSIYGEGGEVGLMPQVRIPAGTLSIRTAPLMETRVSKEQPEKSCSLTNKVEVSPYTPNITYFSNF